MRQWKSKFSTVLDVRTFSTVLDVRKFSTIIEEKKAPAHMVKRCNELVEGFQAYRKNTGKNDYISRDYVIPTNQSFPLQLHRIELVLQKTAQHIYSGSS